MTRAQLKGLLTIPPPILSRFYQELSNGLVGFAQATVVRAEETEEEGDPRAGRWVVELERDGALLSVKPTNLRVRGRL